MFLEKVIAIKKEEVFRRKNLSRREELEEGIAHLPPPRDFKGAISLNGSLALIAEIKRASPSAGTIRENADIRRIAGQYKAGGASAISILTEGNFFGGALEDIDQVKQEVSLPILQKDFIIDPFQVYEGRLAGADAVLLIAAMLEQDQLEKLVELIQFLGMVPLMEVHDEEDLERIEGLDLPLIGINNRNLRTLVVDLETTVNLRKRIAIRTHVVSESGIKNRKDVRRLEEAGIDGILVGEILMRASDPASRIKELLGR